MSIKNNLSAVLFWSVISAAFIGPGTVTTAASAGSGFGVDLIWVLVLSTIACIFLQVNVTSITIRSEKTLGELLLEKFRKFPFIPRALGLSIVFGCVAYQAGNLMGATLGVGLILNIKPAWILLLIVLSASIMLWFGSIRIVVRVLGTVVAIMGIVFVVIAFSVKVSFNDIFVSSFLPSVPVGSEIIVIALIGTTIVPYNLFLGSGLSKGKKLSESTTGLILAISLGGLISIGILIVGTLVSQPFNFDKLSVELTGKLGVWANLLLGIGLFSAGFTSSMTAPIAAVFTIQSVFPKDEKLKSNKSNIYKAIWVIVMGSGLIFGLLDVKPVPAIILAQAINGIILPFVAGFILFLISVERNKNWLDLNLVILSIVVLMIVTIGVFNLLKIFFSAGMILIFISIFIGALVVGITLLFSFFRTSNLPS